MKRLYTKVRVVDVPEGFAVALDDRPIKTPARWPLVLPSRALADAVAVEWRVQGAAIRPETMPLMQLAATVLDHVSANREAMETAALRFAETDLVSYRADQPAELIRLQKITWDPLLVWLESNYGVTLAVTTGIAPVTQPREAIAGLVGALKAMNDWRLCAFQSAAASSGSFVVGLALIDGRIDADEAFRAAELDSDFEIARWGEDPEAAARRAVVAADLAAARQFHDLLGF